MQRYEGAPMTLVQLFNLVRKYWVIECIAPLVIALLALIVALILPNTYTASTSMYVLSRSETPDASGVLQADLSAGQMLTNDVATLMKSERVKSDVAAQFGLDDLDDYDLEITSSATTRVITLEVTGRDKEMATKIANAMVERVSSVANEVMQIESINVIDKAEVPKEPSGPKRLLICAGGWFGGFLLTTLVLALLDRFDTRVRNDREAESLVGIAVVGHFPYVGR